MISFTFGIWYLYNLLGNKLWYWSEFRNSRWRISFSITKWCIQVKQNKCFGNSRILNELPCIKFSSWHMFYVLRIYEKSPNFQQLIRAKSKRTVADCCLKSPDTVLRIISDGYLFWIWTRSCVIFKMANVSPFNFVAVALIRLNVNPHWICSFLKYILYMLNWSAYLKITKLMHHH